MSEPTSPRVILLAGSEPNRRRVRNVLRWTRALVPAMVLVTAPGETRVREVSEDVIELRADDVASGPLSLADALVRAAAASAERGGEGT